MVAGDVTRFDWLAAVGRRKERRDYSTREKYSRGSSWFAKPIADMESLSHLVKVTLPGYLSSLPVPGSVGGIFSLPVSDWVRLLPFAGTITFFAWTAYTKFVPGKKGQTVNKCIMKSSSKVVHSFDIEDLGSKVSFCRCWKSKKFPYCDGSHNAHNDEFGDNVGPLVLKKKDA